jgi:hypothetical protein
VAAVIDGAANPSDAFPARRERSERLRLEGRQIAAASLLERCARSSASAALAGLLRERAARHRQLAEHVRTGRWPLLDAAAPRA